MVITGYLGALHEMMFERTNRSLLLVTCLGFVLTACSRIGYEYDYSDLSHYISYFLNDNDAYFEPGYVFFTNCIKLVFGDNPFALVAMVSIWIVLFVLLAEMTCANFDIKCRDRLMYSRCPACFLFVVILYWGCCFACEGLRNGMAISMLFCATAFAINRRGMWAILICLLAMLFHYSAVILIPGIIILLILDTLEKRTLYYWFAILIGMDVAIYFLQTIQIPFVSDAFNMMGELEMLSHYGQYADEEGENYFSTQYLTYHLFGFLMIQGNLENERYNRAVMLYFVGLSLGTLFQSSIIVMRIQWLYLSMIAFVIYYYLVDRQRYLLERQLIVCVYAFIQSAMVLRYLGWHI